MTRHRGPAHQRLFGRNQPPVGRLAAPRVLELDARGDEVGHHLLLERRAVPGDEGEQLRLAAETLEAVLGELGREAELLTLIAGDGAPLAEQAVSGLVPAGVELEYSWGGQPAYWWLIAAE